jgi:hypothetical protein
MNTEKANVNAGVGDLVSGVGTVAKQVGEATSLESKAQRTESRNTKDPFNLSPEERAKLDSVTAMTEKLNTKY